MTPPSEQPRPRWRARAMAGGVVLAAAAIGGYAAVTREPAAGPESAETAQGQLVTVARAEMHPFVRRVPLSGEARPRKDVRVVAPATGVRVLELLAEQGDFVKRGQALARLDTALVTAQGAAQLAAVKEAEAAEKRATSAYERAESIRDSGALSAEAIETRRAESDAAKARLAQANAAYAEWNSRMGGGYVRAPVAGLVIERQALVGQPVDGQTLFRIVADNALEVAAEVSESDILRLKVGLDATFRLMDGSEVVARLRRPPPAIDSRSRTGAALFDLPRDPRLRSGMFLRGEAHLPAAPMLGVPLAAATYDKSEAFVFVIDEENRARRTPVVLGDREGDLLAVKSGLRAGARVAVGGAAFLQDGDIVRPAETQPASADVAEPARQGG